MTELTQLYTVAEHGRGDCLRTAFACVLDKAHPEEVPIFIYNDDGTENPNWHLEMHQWFWDQGWEWDCVSLEAIRQGKEMYPGTLEMLDSYYVASGRSPRDYPNGDIMHHAVVAHGRDMRIVHDPHPLRTGLRGLPETAYCLTRRAA